MSGCDTLPHFSTADQQETRCCTDFASTCSIECDLYEISPNSTTINAAFNCSSLTRISTVGLVDNITHSVNVSINGQENLYLIFTPPEVALNATYDCVSSVQLQFSAIPKEISFSSSTCGKLL